MATLPESIAVERELCKRRVGELGGLGSAGAFGAALIEDVLLRAERALIGGCPDAMQRALDELRHAAALRCSPLRLPDRGRASNATSYSVYVDAMRA
jgi:hypothetical protein